MKKINIAELLKDCPKGMELDCTLYDDITFNRVQGNEYIIINRGYNGDEVHLTKYGQIFNSNDAKCVIFPKGKTTWEGFHRPFNDGDIITNNEFIAIFHKFECGHMYYHCWYNSHTDTSKFKIDFGIGFIDEYHLATEEEKAKLFDAIKANGYHWNEETKTIEKLMDQSLRLEIKLNIKLI